MDRHTEAANAQIGSSLRAHDTRIVERPGWYQVITPSAGSSVGNEVVLAAIPPAEIEATVRATIREYADAGCAFKWTVGPNEPAELGPVLDRYGFDRNEYRAMAIATTNAAPPVLAVEPVTADTLPVYFDTFSAGWGPAGFSIANPAAWLDDHARALVDGTHAMYLAREGGEPAGTAGICFKQRSGYLIGGNVVPAFRNRGVYRALIAARLGVLAARGIPLGVTYAREATSAPMLEHMGFETVFRGWMYRLADPRAACERFSIATRT
ncbi:MAG: GNAT family N-acetyltransferase [Kofleriaceae bacterium]